MLNPLAHRRVLKKGIPGRATIIEMGTMARGATTFNLPMTLQVHVESLPPYEVEGQWWVKAKDGAALTSGPLAVRVDPDDHQQVAIDWETVRREHAERKHARQEALAAGGAVPIVNISDPQVIDISGGDLAGAEQTLRQLGIDIDLENAIASAIAGQDAGAGAAGEDETIAKLERLAALRASGALTEEEFAEQKRRILGG
jgi:hypothetical protein